MRVARRLVISGRVQGVGFRWFAREAAQREGVMGWVRNLPDGRVEAFAEGEAESVEHMEPALRQDPGGARVKDVFVDSQEPSGSFKDFSIT